MSIEIKKQYDFVDYEKSVEFMKSRVSEIMVESKEELVWFLNHDHIYTQGTSATQFVIIIPIMLFPMLFQLSNTAFEHTTHTLN